MIDIQAVQMQFDFDEPFLKQDIPINKPTERETLKFVFELMDMLTGPIITFSTSWADSIPQQLKQDIKFARLVATFRKEEQATIPEVVAYMITRTYEAPMSHEWTNIYLWCSSDYLKQYRKKSEEDLKEINPPDKLSDYEQDMLIRLRLWIYEKRRQHVKDQLKQSTNQTLLKDENHN